MFELDKLVRENIKGLTPYTSARNEYDGEEGIYLDANENPFGLYNRYPDPNQRALKKALAKMNDVLDSSIFVGNGSDEIIDLVLRIFCTPGRDQVLLFPPTYGMYQVVAETNDIGVLTVPLTSNFQIDLPRVKPWLKNPAIKVVFICSPNNPTGNLMRKRDIAYILKNFDGIVVIDEAYIDFTDDQSWSQVLTKYPNLIVLQTMSKAWALAGVRLGIAFCSESIVNLLNKVKPPYNVSELNQQAALEAIKRSHEVIDRAELISKEKKRTEGELQKLNLVEKVFPSDANFILVKVPDAQVLYKGLVAKKVIVRNRHKEVKNCLRITIGTASENDYLLKCLKEISNEKGLIPR